jgi:hypothetical protein
MRRRSTRFAAEFATTFSHMAARLAWEANLSGVRRGEIIGDDASAAPLPHIKTDSRL